MSDSYDKSEDSKSTPYRNLAKSAESMKEPKTEKETATGNEMKTGRPAAEISVGLVHWPVYDKAGSTVVTNVTNLDIHDIARASTTFGVKNYFIINRVEEQLMFVSRVIDHWRIGDGKSYNHKRHTALNPVRVAKTVEEAVAAFEVAPEIVVTSAREYESPKKIGFSGLRERIWQGSPENRPIFILFGTGWGLHEEVVEKADWILDPIRGMPPEDYRHLSVRSAVSICLDRLLGKW